MVKVLLNIEESSRTYNYLNFKCLRVRHKAIKETIKPKGTEQNLLSKIMRIETTITTEAKPTIDPTTKKEETTTRLMERITISTMKKITIRKKTTMEAKINNTMKKNLTFLTKKTMKNLTQNNSLRNKGSLFNRNSTSAERTFH